MPKSRSSSPSVAAQRAKAKEWAEQNLSSPKSRSSTPNKKSSRSSTPNKKTITKVTSIESEENPRESYRKSRSSNTSERTKELDRELKRLQIEEQKVKIATAKAKASNPVRQQLVLVYQPQTASLLLRFFANVLNGVIAQGLVVALAFLFFLLITAFNIPVVPYYHYNRYGWYTNAVPGIQTILNHVNNISGSTASMSLLFAQPFLAIFGLIIAIRNPGKYLMGLTIVNSYGMEVGFGMKLIRFFLTIFLSTFDVIRFFICCCPGRTCADLLLDTYVVYTDTVKFKRI